MKSDQKRNNKRRAYEKPRLRVINLVAGEVLAVGCKTNDPNYWPANVRELFGCGVGAGCVVVGS
jgi:hypothetical protein